MKTTALVLVALLGVACTVGCDRAKADGAYANDLKPTVARGGTNDDGIKPAPIQPTTPITKSGGSDDGIKPRPVGAPLPGPTNARVGTADDTIKPKPR